MVATNIGVEVTTGLRSGPSNTGAPAGIFHIAGLTARGPVDRPALITSLARYVSMFGDRTPYSSNMFDTARMFFEEGGSELLVSRAVGPAAAAGTLQLLDSMGLPTIEVTAADPGAHSSAFTVTVTTDGADTYSLTVADDGVNVASYRGLTGVSDLVARAASNPYVKIRDLGSTTAAPGNNPVPVSAPLSAGTDDRANLTAASIVDALDTAGEQGAGGAVAAPGYAADVIGALLLDHAARTDKIALLAPHAGASTQEAIAQAADLQANAQGSYGGLFYPHVVVPDGTSSRIVSPEGYVAAVRARAFGEVGFWQVPAGDRAITQWVIGAARQINVEENNTLSAGYVNGIVTTSGRTRLYNWTSLAQDRSNLHLISARDVLNNLTVMVEDALEPLVFSTLDGRGHLFSRVESAVEAVLSPIASNGGFYALVNGDEEIDPGYRVTVDSTNNTLESGAENTVVVDVAVRLSPTAALIKVEIVKVALGGAL